MTTAIWEHAKKCVSFKRWNRDGSSSQNLEILNVSNTAFTDGADLGFKVNKQLTNTAKINYSWKWKGKQTAEKMMQK